MKKLIPILVMFLLSFMVKGQVGGYALKFDGIDDYVSINHNASFNMGKVTIEAWIYWEETNGDEVDFVIGKGLEQFEIHTGGGAGYNGLRFIPKTGLYLDTRQNVIEPNKWFHIAFCYDPNSTGAHKLCYINGKIGRAHV